MSDDLTGLTASELADALAAGETRSVEVTEAFLGRIDELDGDLHAFLHVDRPGAMACAVDVDARRGGGEKLSALAGVPIAVKDLLCTVGQPTTCGSRILEGWVPPLNAGEPKVVWRYSSTPKAGMKYFVFSSQKFALKSNARGEKPAVAGCFLRPAWAVSPFEKIRNSRLSVSPIRTRYSH